jgi:3-isopropylmalate/(R)-2-methylmalate dehydratase large subunit
MALSRPKVRRIDIRGSLPKGVYAKDIILRIIADLGVNGGIGYAYEFGGEAVGALSMEARMTLCNMAIEGGARVGYVNPDKTTFDYLRGRLFAPKGADFDRAVGYWSSLASGPDASYDDVVPMDVSRLEPMLTWGINPGQALGIGGKLPAVASLPEDQRETAEAAYRHMGLTQGQALKGIPIDVAFIGSCTNGRISDLREAAKVLAGRKIDPRVKAIAVPGSKQVARQAEAEGLPEVFRAAGFQWRQAGCSMCLAMNPDKLEGRQLCASSSNRNFIGRQGSPTGRTLLMSPAMVAAAALGGETADVRDYL